MASIFSWEKRGAVRKQVGSKKWLVIAIPMHLTFSFVTTDLKNNNDNNKKK
jgi:hypothetical protein